MTWVNTATEAAGSRKQLIDAIDVSPQSVWMWANGSRIPEPAVCVRIEAATHGAVRRWDIRPHDWHLIWPELIGTEGAPAVPERAEQ